MSYHSGEFEGHGTVWNVSPTGWRLSGNVPLCEGEAFSLTVTFPNEEPVYVAAAVVHWVCGVDYGADTIMIDEDSRETLDR
jgi:hypothetical protein